jgi:hypothetical protein
MFLLQLGYPLYFMLEPVEFVWMLCWVSIGRGNWMSSSRFVLPVVDSCLSLPVEYSSCDAYEGVLVYWWCASLFSCGFVFPYLTFSRFRYCWVLVECTSCTSLIYGTFSYTIFGFIFKYNILAI